MGKIHCKLEPIEAQKAIAELCDYLLGEHWYIADPVCNTQANAIIVDEIKAKYPPADGGIKAWLRWKFEQ